MYAIRLEYTSPTLLQPIRCSIYCLFINLQGQPKPSIQTNLNYRPFDNQIIWLRYPDIPDIRTHAPPPCREYL